MCTSPYQSADVPLERRVEDLLARMTLDEKVEQLDQRLAGDTNPNNVQRNGTGLPPPCGSYLFNQGTLAARNALQRRAIEKSRLGIPAIFGADVIHGYYTIFPIPLASACSWNPELLRESCRQAAIEAKGNGVDWTFAPMIDIALDPRWGRIAEGFGESPFAVSAYCRASVHGFQEAGGAPAQQVAEQGAASSEAGAGTREPVAKSDSPLPAPRSPLLAACLKHYVGYGASEGGRDYSYTDISPQRLWELYLPPYEAGVRAGACTVMSAFNDLNGVPATANRYTLTEILRGRWGFKGFVVSDWHGVEQLITQGFAADEADAVQKAIDAGVDMDMVDGLYRKHLKGLVESGRVSRQTVDEAVRRVLCVKFELGLFERPYREEPPANQSRLRPAALKVAEELAAQSLVLLKNERGTLPISGRKRIALIGPLADDAATLLGTWIQRGSAADSKSIAASLREKAPADLVINTARGCDIDGQSREGFDEAVRLAKASDLVVLCLGEAAWMSAENASRSSIDLPGVQEELALAAAAAGKPIVLVVSSGRPIALQRIEPKMDAILAIWQPGTLAGPVVVDTLLGRRNPSGRLCVTFPRTTGQIPIFHNMRPRARTGSQGAYQDIPTTPLYEFGHGLSYTTFKYGPIRVAADHVARGKSLLAEVTVANTGPRDGDETVFWFVRPLAASITQPIKELKHFEKATIAAGASRTFRFAIDVDRDLSYPDAHGNRIIDRGTIVLTAGPEQTRFEVR